MFSKKSNSQTKRLFSFIIICYLKNLNTIQFFHKVKKRDRLILKDFHHIFQNVIAARQKNLKLDFDYNLFSFKLSSSIISNQFFQKSILDSFNDIDLFDLKIRSSSSLKSFNKSFDKHVSFEQFVSFVNSLRTQSLRTLSFRSYERKYQNNLFIKNNAIERFFRVLNMTERNENQLILMNLWHYVEIENVESIDLIVSISIIFEKFRKIKINNFKVVTIMRNRLKCNDKNFLKNEINAKNAWKILKNLFNSFESKMLNDLLIKLWIIILVNNQNVTNYAWRFKMTMQDIREMIINVLINDNFFILYFHLNLDAKFEQYRKHYAQTHEIVSNESNSTRNINYAINRFLNICVNRSISKKSTLVMIVITSVFVLNSFFDKIQLNAQLKIKNVVIIIVKMCIICEKKYHTTSEHREQFNLKRDRD